MSVFQDFQNSFNFSDINCLVTLILVLVAAWAGYKYWLCNYYVFRKLAGLLVTVLVISCFLVCSLTMGEIEKSHASKFAGNNSTFGKSDYSCKIIVNNESTNRTFEMGRLVVQFDPYIRSINHRYRHMPYGKIWISENKITSETYFGQSSMHEIILGLPVAEAGFKYNIFLLDWTADGHAPDENTNPEQIVPANKSTTDVIVDNTGDVSIKINGAQAFYIKKRVAIDSAGKTYTLPWILDKENKVLRIGELDKLRGAIFPVSIT